MVSRTNSYSQLSTGVLRGPIPPDAKMISALYNGLITPPQNSTSNVVIHCKTGNCTFPSDDAGASYSSLAVGFSCQDLSDNITEYEISEGLSYSLHSGANVTSSRPLDISQPNNSSRTDIFTFDLLTVVKFAVRCSLFPVINTYGASISQGVLQEVLLETNLLPYAIGNFGALNSDEFVTSEYFLAGNSTLRNGMWHDCNPSENPTAENTIPAQRCVPTEDNVCETEGPSHFYPSDCIWYFGTTTTDGMGSFLYELMIGQSLMLVGSNYNSSGVVDYGTYLSGNIWIQNLYNSGSPTMDSVNEYMEGLSNSITAIIRQGDTSGNSTQGWAQGTVLGMQTCIQVQWRWISLPAVTLALVFAFMGMTVLRTGQSSMVWKSSSLALLFHGLSPDTRDQYGELGRVKDLDRVAKGMQATLERTDAGWAFVEHTQVSESP